MTTVVLGLRVVLAAVFLTAGVGKLLDMEGSRRALRDFRVPGRAVPATALLLPLAEIAAGLALIFRPSARWGALAALILVAAFIAGIVFALARGEEPDCHCFGQIHSAPAGRLTLARNAVLVAFAAVIVAYGSGPAVDTWVGARSASELVAIGVGIFAVAALGYALTLRAELRRARGDLGIAQQTAVTNRFGHPIGTEAPSFSLSDLRGATVTLDTLLERAQPLLLVFVSPSCGPCLTLVPRVHQWQETLSERVTIAVISTGTTEQNAWLAAVGLEDVLLQQEIEVQKMYGVSGTPTAVLVSAEGQIASALGESEFGIEPLLRLALRQSVEAPLEASTA
jgi:uncharacterized membrane protein YphA (DoxX/SURF4 family)/thiol-disulfide isomerase/thioredoxin